MKELLVWGFISGLAFIVFMTTFIVGLKKRSKPVKLLFRITLVAFIGCVIATGYKLITKLYNSAAISGNVDTNTGGRSGEKIYQSLFGRPLMPCLQVLNRQDHTLPYIDCCIWLEMKTCPQEIQRILNQGNYELNQADSTLLDLLSPDFGEKPAWWIPHTLGDTVLVFRYKHSTVTRKQELFLSRDSTKAYYVDIDY